MADHEQAVEAMDRAINRGRRAALLSDDVEGRRRALAGLLQAALPHLEQERPDQQGSISRLGQLAERAPQDKPPSRAGEVAEELRRLADRHTVNDAQVPSRRLREWADKLTEQEPSRDG